MLSGTTKCDRARVFLYSKCRGGWKSEDLLCKKGPSPTIYTRPGSRNVTRIHPYRELFSGLRAFLGPAFFITFGIYVFSRLNGEFILNALINCI
jgi:hypothetical protein